MIDTFFIRPAIEGSRLQDPGRDTPLPDGAAGVERERNSYWLNHILHGDVVEVPPVQAAGEFADKP